MGGAVTRSGGDPTTNTTTTEEAVTWHDWTETWFFFFFSIERPGATMTIAGISIVHSLCHVPHLLMFRRLGLITGFWSLVGVGLLLGAVTENEIMYDVWIWYSCMYVPLMLVTMVVVLTAAIWELTLRPLRVIFATVGVMFYLFMFYCIVFVMAEKRKIWTTTMSDSTTTTACPTCDIDECTEKPNWRCTDPRKECSTHTVTPYLWIIYK